MKAHLQIISLAISAGALLGACAPNSAEAEAAPAEVEGSLKPAEELLPNDWLVGAGSDLERFERIQKNSRGFDQPMWEVGERYERLYQALQDENFLMARYQWRKIKTTIENGIMKRPGRAENANLFLLNEVWQTVDDDFKSEDLARAWAGFELARSTCMSCHLSEDAMGYNAGFMNDAPIFRDLLPPESVE